MTNYNNPFSVDHRKPVFLDSSDPRYKNLEQYRSRLGRDISIADIDESKALEVYKDPGPYWLSQMHNNLNYHTSGVYVSGMVENDNYLYLSFFSYTTPKFSGITKCSTSGNIKWNKKIYNEQSNELVIISMDYLSNDNIIIFGYMYDTKHRLFLSCLSSDGSTKIWEKEIVSPTETYYIDLTQRDQYITCIVDKKTDSIYICGIKEGYFGAQLGIETRASYLIKFDKNGIMQWKKRLISQGATGGSGFAFETDVQSITIDKNSNIYVLSRVGGFPVDTTGVCKIQPDGNTIFNYIYQTNNGSQHGYRNTTTCSSLLLDSKEEFLYFAQTPYSDENGNDFKPQIVKIKSSDGTPISSTRVPEVPYTSLGPFLSISENDELYLYTSSGGGFLAGSRSFYLIKINSLNKKEYSYKIEASLPVPVVPIRSFFIFQVLFDLRDNVYAIGYINNNNSALPSPPSIIKIVDLPGLNGKNFIVPDIAGNNVVDDGFTIQYNDFPTTLADRPVFRYDASVATTLIQDDPVNITAPSSNFITIIDSDYQQRFVQYGF